ncbi:MAG: FtsQ-type POTRA domain-containing protein [Acidimicrobiales bacterium]|nr:FtsQ-type POTRA domain-containing protein [Acidimicrobiales bacterium]
MTTVSIDPRLRARRSAVLRAQGRRRLRRLIIGLSTIFVVALAWFVVRSSLFDVDSISWSGLDQVSMAEASEVAGIDIGSSLSDADPATIASRLESLPWVLDARVERSWWGSVSISITERTAAALVMTRQDVWVVVDEGGHVLSGPSDRTDLPRLSGIAAAGEPGSALATDSAALLEVVALLPERVKPRVEGVARDDLGELWISLNTADRILLGPAEDLSLKVIALASVLDKLDVEGRTGWEMDVAVPTLPVVRDLRAEWQPPAADDGEAG